VEVRLHEGKHHEVRRLLQALGHPVEKLKRVGLGMLTSTNLAVGEFRSLAPREVASFLRGRGNTRSDKHAEVKAPFRPRKGARPGSASSRPAPASTAPASSVTTRPALSVTTRPALSATTRPVPASTRPAPSTARGSRRPESATRRQRSR